MRAREAVSRTHLTHVERLLLAVLADHDRSQFNPSVSLLAENLYGKADYRTREETRQVLRRLEEKGEINREYRTKGSGADDYTHIALSDEADFSGANNGSTPLNNGATPLNNGSTPGPKSKKSKKDNAAASGGESRGNSMEGVEDTFLGFAGSQWFLDLGLENMDPDVWEKLGNRLGRWYSPEEKVYGLGMFLNDRGEDIQKAKNPPGYVVKVLPVWLGENVDAVRAYLESKEA